MRASFIFKTIISSVIILAQPVMASAQNIFAPAIRVNDGVVTYYELQQRTEFLRLLRAPGNREQLAREQLIDDKLKLEAAAALGISLDEASREAGLEEFAARANLSGKEFLQQVKQAGVEAQTVYDFLRPGLLWRDVVRARFGAQSEVSPSEIDRALVAEQTGGGLRVLLSEVIIPLDPQAPEATLALAERIAQAETAGQFAAYARQYSATESAGNGGNLPWRNLDELPDGLQRLILEMKPGNIVGPLTSTNAVALFRMRDMAETGFRAPTVNTISYMEFMVQSTLTDSVIKRLNRDFDQCDDLYGLLPAELSRDLTLKTEAPGDVPTAFATVLAGLDPNEYQMLQAPGGTRVIMLCARDIAPPEASDEEAFAFGLRNRKLAGFAESYLDELRQDAQIAFE